ncbi:thiosulfate/3-mercaptopyruvate sulfurtransferase [Pelagirhabdus alkalitolerans]|uniref:Thiosulfate/3-mercaptopyruvate sulfurtransferase n=1 Tax=Pelagirhabdus alkalitolerans TaxID=1612202 RepID=A0A1G6JMG9_9BACI|nr:sulfurtransferase [Pelagirhabdus alkalitolerans]SDC19903.1 thiosulfate/3-mercaptopyruvate sulfurtransferase [Pelagirhabdus alkalitolerans]
MDFLINADELYNRMEDVVIIDVRFELMNPDKGYELYRQSHIPGAVYFDLNKDLSSERQKHGGYHPLPEQNDLLTKLSKAGVTKDSTIVIYDQGDAMFAARLFWLLDYYNHERKFILDGGFKAWISKGFPTTRVVKRPSRTSYAAQPIEEMTVDIEQVKQKKDRDDTILLDARSIERFNGEYEPIYDKAGHIPGAKCFDWTFVLNDEGKWKTKEELSAYFEELDPDKEIILSCGSGVSTSMNYLALTALGYKNIRLYPGSYSDWISYPELPIATKKDLE